MAAKYSFQVISRTTENDASWDRSVEQSAEGTVFSLTDYLQATGRKFARIKVMKGNEFQAGVSLILTEDETECELDDLVIYNGIFFSKANSDQKRSTTLHKHFELTEAIVQELTSRFRRITLALCPGIDDVRPFLWHGYNAPAEASRFTCDIRYTSYLNISSILDFDDETQTDTFKELDLTRKQRVRSAIVVGRRARETNDVDEFLSLYLATFRRQGIETSEVRAKALAMGSLIRSLQSRKLAKVFIISNQDGRPASGAVFGFDSKRAYWLFGGSDPDAIEPFSGTMVLWDAFKELRKLGLTEVDLEGVNSPQRGAFKLSFGGRLVPYTQVCWKSVNTRHS